MICVIQALIISLSFITICIVKNVSEEMIGKPTSYLTCHFEGSYKNICQVPLKVATYKETVFRL